MRPVFLRSAELGAPFTDKPVVPLRESMAEAASRAISEAGLRPGDIDAVFVAAMGSFAHEQFMGGLPLWLASALGLSRADVSPMLIGSSETGAWALRSAVQALRHDDGQDHVLVVSGEQMNPLASERPRGAIAIDEERRARNRTISQVVDEADRRYGLNMLRMSDLIMDLLCHLHDWSLPDLTDLVLPFVALEKYRRVRRYPYGQFHANRKETVAQVLRSARLTHYFRLDDVTPTSTGCVAVVLSSRPEGPKRTVEILGMGQGYVPASLTARRGDPGHMQSVRDAYLRAASDAGVGLDWLLGCDFAVIHDAFPSIEYFFLRELGLGPADIVRRMISGWSNPFGGLKGCGHALGASGMLQVAKSFHAFTGDPRYLSSPEAPPSPFPELVRRPPFRTAFTTSVGGVLTNVLVTLLAARDEQPPNRPAQREPGAAPATTAADAGRIAAPPIGPPRGGDGVHRVLARTRLRHEPAFGDDTLALTRAVREPWIYLLEVADGGPAPGRRLAWSAEPFAVGQLVRAAQVALGDEALWRAEALQAPRPAEPYVEVADDAERARFLIDLERRLHAAGHAAERLDFLEPPEPLLGGRCLAYAQLAVGDAPGQRWLKARLLAALGDARVGTVVEHHALERRTAPASAESALASWTVRRAVLHPALARVLELGADADQVFCVRELPGGVSLASLVGTRDATARRALEHARAIAGGLAALHGAGLVHGEVDPQHVLITARERAMLLEPRVATPLPTATVADDLRGLGLVLLALAVRDPGADGNPRARLVDLAARCLGWTGAGVASAAEVVAALAPAPERP